MFSLILFKIITAVSRLSTLLRVFFMGRLGCPTKGGNWDGVSLQTQQFELSPSVGYYPTTKLSPPVSPLITDHILEREISLIAFRQILPNILLAICIFSSTIMSYLKKLIETVSLNTKQCPAGLPPRTIPHDPLNIYGKPWGWGRNPPTAKNLLIPPPSQKNPLTSSAIKNVISSAIKQQFLSNYPIQISFAAVVIAVVYIFFNFRVYVHICHANVD